MSDSDALPVAEDDLGVNAWLVDEMRERWREDPDSVDANWHFLFTENGDHASSLNPEFAVAADSNPAPSLDQIKSSPDTSISSHSESDHGFDSVAGLMRGVAQNTRSVSEPRPSGIRPMRGAAARIASNMDASLSVPTATGFRDVPAKLLEVNRKIINGHLNRKLGDRISLTHLIGYAVVRAIADAVPAMNRTFSTDDGRPCVADNDHIGLGLAVDVLKSSDDTRSLLVPVVHQADTLDFRTFVDRCNIQVAKARNGSVTADDFAGTTVTLTNPGGIGTRQSVPRLMVGQGTIVGVGALAFPAEFQAADRDMLAELGVSKLVTITSTYDHRVIQGAESGLFLKKVHDLLLGADDFYTDVFRSLGIPYEAVKWRVDFNPADRESVMLEKQAKVNQLINQYRVRGHLIADLDPLRLKEPVMHAELDPATYGLTIWDLDRQFLTGSETGIYATVGGTERMPLGELLGVLRDAYCRTVGVEYMHIQQPAEKRWMQEQIEGADASMERDDQRHILDRLNAAEALGDFLGAKYVGQKRFGLEGAESAVPLIEAVLACAADDGMASVVMGMAHRGRLNVLVNVMGKSYQELFSQFEGTVTVDHVQGSGDVIYHLGQQGYYTSPTGNTIEVEVAANPSHLEAVDPVVVGMARARMDAIGSGASGCSDGGRSGVPGASGCFYPVLPLLVHGDAAFAGQGVVAETLNLSQIKGYRVGGTVHVVINNQLGFTTTPNSARSSEYSTDVAKMIGAPIFHVNGDDPEACVRVARLAFAYRREFNKDAVIDMICYRRHGHNEADDPSYTLPDMYRRINAKPTVREQYTAALVKRGDLTVDEQEASLADLRSQLQRALDETRHHKPAERVKAKPPPAPVGVLPHVCTAIDAVAVERIYQALSSVPEGFSVHPKLARQFARRDRMFEKGGIDWALGEAMAFGSLLMEGTPLRLSGQDSCRGTFAHRHSTLVDYETSAEYVPLSVLCDLGGGENPGRTSGLDMNEDLGQGSGRSTDLWIYDSLLSEYAALGFEYGYAVARPEALVMWEAQFGDFANGAQVIIDQFIVAAEDKWGQRCGIVLLLPHGFEGQGPEHSSARIERFLALAAEDNIQVCTPTTAAQYFHLLRRQVVRGAGKPLIIFTPKSLLRSRSSRSRVAELTSGTFEEVLGDSTAESAGSSDRVTEESITGSALEPVDPSTVRRVLLCSGKVAYDAMALRDSSGAPVAVCRIEQLFPWPSAAVAEQLDRYPAAREIVWLQEEPENMGPWSAVKGRLYGVYEGTHEIRRVSRPESGSPACGSARVHAQEQTELISEAVLD